MKCKVISKRLANKIQMKTNTIVTLLVGCYLTMSCENDSGFSKIHSIEDAQMILGTIDSLEQRTYLTMDLFTRFEGTESIDTTFNGVAGGSALVSGEVKTERFGGHCGGPDRSNGSLAVDLIDYNEGAQFTNTATFDYTCTGVWSSGICVDPRSYARHDTLTFVAPYLDVVYIDHARGINIKDGVEVKVIYIHEYYQLRPFGEPYSTIDSTVTRKYYVKSTTGETFEW